MTPRISKIELIALMAMMLATLAMSIDAMLPSLPVLAEQLVPEAPNVAQMVVTSFIFGMGLGTFLTGPLGDAFGRKPVVLGGIAIYILGALACVFAQSIEMLLAARLVQGLGSAGPRVMVLAIIRDLFKGREMAKISSLVMTVFSLVPAVAPLMGAAILTLFDWRGIFAAFVVFSSVIALWVMARLDETLPEAQRRPLRLPILREALTEIFAHPVVRLSIIVQTLCFAMLFTTISVVQPVYDIAFGRGDEFPFWFAAIVLVAAFSGPINAALVLRVGMQSMIRTMLVAQVVFSSALLLIWLAHPAQNLMFAVFVFWQTAIFFQAGITLGNITAIGMEPLGHIAGTAASILAAVSTIGAVLMVTPVSLMFDGTPVPLAIAVLIEAVLALWAMRLIGRHRETPVRA